MQTGPGGLWALVALAQLGACRWVADFHPGAADGFASERSVADGAMDFRRLERAPAMDAPADDGVDLVSPSANWEALAAPLCGGSRWCWEHPLPHGYNLNALWVSNTPSPAAMAVGEGGVALFYDGGRWNVGYVGTVGNLYGVWGRGPREIYAVGQDGVFHFDGASWTRVYQSAGRELRAVSGDEAGTALVAVGSGCTLVEAKGDSWQLLDPTPCPSDTGSKPDLAGVSVAGGMVVAVGTTGTIIEGTAGGPYQAAGAPVTDKNLKAVWGTVDGRFWAVGSEGVVVRRLPGDSGWEEALAPSELTTASLKGIWGRSGTELFVVGEKIALRYEGVSWRVVWVGTRSLNAVAGNSHELLAVGTRGTLMHFEAGWSSIWPRGELVDEALNAVVAIDNERAVAVGEHGTVLERDRYGWRPMVALGYSRRLRGVAVSSGAGPVVVGEFNSLGFAARQTPSGEWLELALPEGTPPLNAVVRTAQGMLILAGKRGTLLEETATGWTGAVIAQPGDSSPLGELDLQSLWASPQGAIYCIGGKDLLLTRSPQTGSWLRHRPLTKADGSTPNDTLLRVVRGQPWRDANSGVLGDELYIGGDHVLLRARPNASGTEATTWALGSEGLHHHVYGLWYSGERWLLADEYFWLSEWGGIFSFAPPALSAVPEMGPEFTGLRGGVHAADGAPAEPNLGRLGRAWVVGTGGTIVSRTVPLPP